MIKICEICNTKFEGRKNAIACSPECKTKLAIKRLVSDSKAEYPNGSDYVECAICGLRCGNLQRHIANAHDLNNTEYAKLYPTSQIMSKSTRVKLSESVTGEKNPGYQHGGRLSPWSSKSEKHSEETIKSAKQKAAENCLRPNQMQYWLEKGFSEKEAKEKVTERQTTFSLDICIEKYGEIEGTARWQERQDKWQETLNAKPQEEINEINRRKVSSGSISKAETELYEYLKLEFGDLVTNQFSISNSIIDGKSVKRGFIYDIRIDNVLVEYHGDMWHMNPSMFSENDVNRVTKQAAKDKWEEDRVKAEYASNAGYTLITIWESEYNQDKETTLQRCVNEIKKHLKEPTCNCLIPSNESSLK